MEKRSEKKEDCVDVASEEFYQKTYEGKKPLFAPATRIPKPLPEEEVDKSGKWVQCDRCGKWRTVAEEVDDSKLPEVWKCSMNTWKPKLASCEAPEEPKPDEEKWIGLPEFFKDKETEEFYVDLTRVLHWAGKVFPYA